MSKKDLRNDYDLIESVDENGRMVSRVDYRGGYYSVLDLRAYKRARMLVPALTIVAAMAYILPLAVANAAARAIYFVICYIGQVFPIFFLFGVSYCLLFKKPPFKERERRTMTERAKTLCITGGAMASASIVAFIVYLIVEGASGVDFLSLASAFVCAVSYVLIFLASKAVTLKRSETTDNDLR